MNTTKHMKQEMDRFSNNDIEAANFNCFAEKVIDCFSDSFYQENQEWIESSFLLDEWLNTLYSRGISYRLSAMIVERDFEIFVRNK